MTNEQEMVGKMFNAALGREPKVEKKTIGDVIEMLQCAQMNCDNVKKMGVGFADLVKTQITEALSMLEQIDS